MMSETFINKEEIDAMTKEGPIFKAFLTGINSGNIQLENVPPGFISLIHELDGYNRMIHRGNEPNEADYEDDCFSDLKELIADCNGNNRFPLIVKIVCGDIAEEGVKNTDITLRAMHLMKSIFKCILASEGWDPSDPDAF
ncbi:MAG: hypothetical protein IJV90_06910 [Candidatus Methanomethylophilaceae archaeon]|nr:hypothetical protein [Candidatus Methanomethylophilaceae archaeon]